MTTLYYTYEQSYNLENVLKDIETQNPKSIVFFGQLEWEMPHITKEFVESVYKQNVKLHIVHGCFRSQHHIDHYNYLGIPIEDIIFWGTHFFNYVYMHLSGNKVNNPSTYTPKEFKHKFISLNNRSHIHRCTFIEEMAKQNLLDKGIVTWIAHLNENSDYPYQYFDGNKRTLNDGFIEHLDSYHLPIEYSESLFELITESTPHIQFITEKTIRNLLHKKPFVILGAKGIHKTLVDLGFKLYDEVIDYSFDDIDDLKLRTEMYVNNVHNILRYDPQELYDILLPKLLYNYHRAMSIVTDKSLIPTEFREYAEKHDPAYIRIYDNVNYEKTKYVSVWGSHDLSDVDQAGMIVIDQTVEMIYEQLAGDDQGVKNLISSHSDIPIRLLTSTYKYNAPRLNLSDYPNVENIDSPGYWLSKAFQEASEPRNRDINLVNGYDLFDSNVNLNSHIDKLYISMNNIAHKHRCKTMDILSKHNLIHLGNISWRDVIRKFDDDRNDIPDSIRFGYKYDYWTPTRMFLDFGGNSSEIEQALLPSQYKSSFMQLVPESMDASFFLTEKTATALLYNKIFLTVGSKNFHSILVDMGFKLYDNLFDYSFDSLDDTVDRIEGIVQNIKRYKDYTTTQLAQLIKDNEHIIRHNRQVALDYVFNKVPNDFKLIQSILAGQNIITRLDGIYNILEYKNEIL